MTAVAYLVRLFINFDKREPKRNNTHANDVSNGDGQTNDEGRDCLALGLTGIASSAHDDHEDERQEELDPEALNGTDLVLELDGAEHGFLGVRGQGLEHRRSSDGARALGHYVEDRPDNRDLRVTKNTF